MKRKFEKDGRQISIKWTSTLTLSHWTHKKTM